MFGLVKLHISVSQAQDMPVAEDRLELLQVLKLLQSVRLEDGHQIEKLTANGIPNLINYSGKEIEAIS